MNLGAWAIFSGLLERALVPALAGVGPILALLYPTSLKV